MTIETTIAQSPFRRSIAAQTDLPENSLAPETYITAAKARSEQLSELLQEEMEMIKQTLQKLHFFDTLIIAGELTIKDCIDLKTLAFELALGEG